MADFDLVTLGASELRNGIPVVVATNPVGDDDGDVEPIGTIDIVSQLGISALPAAATEAGSVQGPVLFGCGGSDGICVGARDTRNGDIYGALKPGDTVMHATGPNAVSQVMCKADKRQVVLATKDSENKQELFIMDGKGDKVTLAAFGYVVDVSRKFGINLTDATGKAGIQIKDGVVSIYGQVVLAGRTPNAALALMLGPKIGSPGGVASPPLMPAMGVFIGL